MFLWVLMLILLFQNLHYLNLIYPFFHSVVCYKSYKHWFSLEVKPISENWVTFKVKNIVLYYKDRKCAVNENPSVRIESAQSKTSNNGLLRNGSAVSIARLYVDSKIVCFYESDHAFKTIWRRPCSCHLVKINRYFFQPGRLVFFIIVINTSCSGVCYRIYALTLSIYCYIPAFIFSVTVTSHMMTNKLLPMKESSLRFLGQHSVQWTAYYWVHCY